MARGSLLQVIPVATELEREGRAGQQIQAPPDNGLEAALSGRNGVASQLGAIGQRIGQMADHAAGVEGKQAGHLAGLDPEFRPRNDGTIRGEAFDRAALDTYLAKTRVEIDNDIQGTALKHQADPAGLSKVLQGREAGWLQNAPVELHPEIKTLFAHGSLVAQRAATRQLWERQAAEQRGAMQEELQSSMRLLHQGAFAAGLDPAADEVMATRISQLEGALRRRGPDGKPLVDPAAAVKLIADAKEQVSTARLQGAFERLPDLGAKEAFLKQLDTDFAGSTGLAKAYDLQTFQQVRRHLEAELHRDQAKARQASGTLGHIVKEVQHRADKGYGVPEAELSAVRARVIATGDAETIAALGDAEDSLRFQQAARRLPLPQLEQTVGEMRQHLATNPPTLADRGRINRRLEKAEALLTQAQGEVKSNPLGWEARVGMADVVPLGNVDLRDAGAVQAWGAGRVAQAEDAAQRHALGKPVYLQPVEKRALAKQFERGGQDGLAAVTFVTRAFGEQRAQDVLAELGKDAPAGALIGRLALTTGGNNPGVLDAAEGLHIKAQPGHKNVAPSRTDALLEVRNEIGAALGENTPYLDQAMKVADAIYERRAYRDGKTAVFDGKEWRKALREALGEHEVGGRIYGGIAGVGGGWFGGAVVLPPSVAKDKAAATFAAITPEDLGGGLGGGPRHGNGVALTRQELRGATFITKEPGKYWVKLSGGLAAGDDGRPYVMDLDAALPLIRKRRPDLR